MSRISKGKSPVVPLAERLEIVRNIKFVDDAVAEVVPSKLDTLPLAETVAILRTIDEIRRQLGVVLPGD